MIVEHPDGGHCNTDGMTHDCYGCICYGGGLINECKERVAKLLDSINNQNSNDNAKL